MATTSNANSSKSNLERVQDLLTDLKEEARKAEASGELFLLATYEEILSVVSPIVLRAAARLEREEMSSLRKSLKERRKSARSSSNGSTP